MKKNKKEPPLRKWQYVFAAFALVVSAIGAAGVWYGNKAKSKESNVNIEGDAQVDRVNCSVVAENVSENSNIEISVGQSLCSE